MSTHKPEVDLEMVEVTKSEFEAFIKVVKTKPGYVESGADVGRTHGRGYHYLNGTTVAEWSWLMECDRTFLTPTRVWSWRIPAAVHKQAQMLVETAQELENKYIVIALADLRDDVRTDLIKYMKNMQIPERHGCFVERHWPMYADTVQSIQDWIITRIKGKAQDKGEQDA